MPYETPVAWWIPNQPKNLNQKYERFNIGPVCLKKIRFLVGSKASGGIFMIDISFQNCYCG